MFSFQPRDYLWLAGGAVVFIALFVVLARRIMKNSALRHEPQVQSTPIPAQRTEFTMPTIHTEVGETVRGTFEPDELRALITVASAMAGFGPTQPYPVFRQAAEGQMGDEGDQMYLIFVRTFLVAFELPRNATLSDRTVFELSAYPEQRLLDHNNALTFLVTYAKQIDTFYRRSSADHNLTKFLPSFITMSGVLDRLKAIHAKYYAG